MQEWLRPRKTSRDDTPAEFVQPYVEHVSPRYHELKNDVRRVIGELSRIEDVLVTKAVSEAAQRVPRHEDAALYAPADVMREIDGFVALAMPDVAAFEHDVERIETEYARLQAQADDRHRLASLRR